MFETYCQEMLSALPLNKSGDGKHEMGKTQSWFFFN